MLPQRFFSRILLAFTLLLAAVVIGVDWIGERRIEAFHREEVLRRLDTASELLVDHATALLRGDTVAARDGDRIIEHVHKSGLRATVVDAAGEVRFESDAVLPVQNHGGRPEILEAATHGRGTHERTSATTGAPTLYLARRVGDAAAPLGYVRVAADLLDLEDEVTGMRKTSVVVGVGVLLLGLGVTMLLSRWFARPVEALAVSATRLADGALDERVHVEGPVEVSRLAIAMNRMADELRGRIRTLQTSRGEVEAILRALTEGVIAVAPDETLLHMNDAAARMLGLAKPLAAGSTLWRAVRFPELENALRAVLRGAPKQAADADSPADDGRTLHVSVARVSDEIGAVAVLADVTDVRRLEQMRIDFVANVSHEIRTPLASILGSIETLADHDLDEATRAKFVAVAQRNSERLMAIVADLLELSRIETEGDRMQTAPVSLVGVVRSVASALGSAAERKRLKLDVAAADPERCTVPGNRQRLEQVFTNLIENAVKYTPDGGAVRIHFAVDADTVSVAVEDTGVGIPQEALPRVFERFYRVDPSRSRDMGGTGLGLAIVKHAVRAHGGTVSVKSEEGVGTTFTVTLPRA